MNIATAIEQARRDVVDSMWKTGTVTGTSGTKVIVSVAGGSLTIPRLTSYTPTVGDVVIIAGRPGAWFVVGKPA